MELVLKVCHLLLWPHLLRHAAGEASCVREAFLSAWHTFLMGLQKHIKNMQPEDQAVKVGWAGCARLGRAGLGWAGLAVPGWVLVRWAEQGWAEAGVGPGRPSC